MHFKDAPARPEAAASGGFGGCAVDAGIEFLDATTAVADEELGGVATRV